VKRLVPVLVAMLAAGVFAAVVLADTTPPVTTTTSTDTTPTTTTTTAQQVVPAGVTIERVQIGGLPVDQAVAAVEQAFAQPLTLRFDTTSISVSTSILGGRVSADTAVARALTVAPNAALSLRGGYDATLVRAFLDKLSKRFNRQPVSSRLFLRAERPFVTKPVVGRTIDRSKAYLAITDELVHATRSAVTLKAKLTQPPVTPKTIGPVILIRRSANRLTLYNGMKTVRTFTVATGQNVYPTPLGRFQIVVKWKNPWWYPPTQDSWAKGLKPVPPGPNNPLGTRWMGLSSPGVGIHGTDEPASIGYSLSHGCIRMLVPQAEWLFNHVDVGTPVFIISA
jgi:lipoprotein-anchoring transpeptidase ErfK/SrfK